MGEEMTSCEQVEAASTTLVSRQAAEAIGWAGWKRRVAAELAHLPSGAAGEAPAKLPGTFQRTIERGPGGGQQPLLYIYIYHIFQPEGLTKSSGLLNWVILPR